MVTEIHARKQGSIAGCPAPGIEEQMGTEPTYTSGVRDDCYSFQFRVFSFKFKVFAGLGTLCARVICIEGRLLALDSRFTIHDSRP